MKKIISICAVVLLALGVACAKADRPIKVSEMPQAAQTFLKTHFPNVKISFAKVDDENFSKEYEVMLIDGTDIEFDGKGEWESVDCKYSHVPEAIIPAPIMSYINEHYTDVKVLKIDRDGGFYELSLTNHLELKFDMKFNLVDIDD